MKTIIVLLFAAALGWGAYSMVSPLIPSAGELVQREQWRIAEACLDGHPSECRYLRDVERLK